MKLKSISFSLRAVVMLLAFLTTAVAQEPQIVDEVVARVNSDIITRSALLKAEAEFISQIKQSFPNDEAKQKEEIEKGLSTLIELLIEEKLIAQRAAELSVDVEPDINRTILELIKQTNPNWGLKEFQDYLSQQNIDIEDVRKVYRTQLQRRVLLFREVINPIYDKLKPEEKKEWYESHLDLFRLPGEYKLSEIFITYEARTPQEAEKIANQAVSEIRSGKPFVEVVKLYSDPKRPSTQKNGELPILKENEIIEYLKKVVEGMKNGDISNPIQTDKGLQIVRLDEYKESSFVPFTDVEAQVAEQLAIERGNQKVKEYFKKLRDKSYVRIAEPYKPENRQQVESAKGS